MELETAVMHSQINAAHSLHCFPYLWSTWVRGVVEMILIDGEIGARFKGREIFQPQCLEVIDLLHKSCGAEGA